MLAFLFAFEECVHSPIDFLRDEGMSAKSSEKSKNLPMLKRSAGPDTGGVVREYCRRRRRRGLQLAGFTIYVFGAAVLWWNFKEYVGLFVCVCVCLAVDNGEWVTVRVCGEKKQLFRENILM